MGLFDNKQDDETTDQQNQGAAGNGATDGHTDESVQIEPTVPEDNGNGQTPEQPEGDSQAPEQPQGDVPDQPVEDPEAPKEGEGTDHKW